MVSYSKETLLNLLCSILRNCEGDSIEIYPHRTKRRINIIPGVNKLHLHGLLFELGFLKWAAGGKHVRTTNFDQIPALLSMCDPSLTTRMNVKYLDNSKHYFVQFTNPNDKSEPLSQSDMNILEELRKKCVDNNKNAMITARRKKDMKNRNEEYDDISNAFVSNTLDQAETKTRNRKRKVSIESADLEEDADPRSAPMEWYNNVNMSKRIQVGHSKRLKEVTVPKNYTVISDYNWAQMNDENSRMKLELSL